MDIISLNEAATANGRIERFIENPDSTSGIVTVPKTIASGETVTIPAGRVAVLPNVVVDGDLVVEAGGEVFVPAGANFSDLEGQIATKQAKGELAYNVDTSSYIPNTLASGAIIERGSNANGEYIKFADGTLICRKTFGYVSTTTFTIANKFNSYGAVAFPSTFVSGGEPSVCLSLVTTATEQSGRTYAFTNGDITTGGIYNIGLEFLSTVSGYPVALVYMAIGRWK